MEGDDDPRMWDIQGAKYVFAIGFIPQRKLPRNREFLDGVFPGSDWFFQWAQSKNL